MIFPRQTVVVPDGPGTHVPALSFEWPSGSDVVMPFAVKHADGTPYDLSGPVAALLSFRNHETEKDAILSREEIITDAAAGEIEFYVTRDDRLILKPGYYAAGIVFQDDGVVRRDIILLTSRVSITIPVATFDDPVSVPPIQQPLAQGPAGPQGPPGPGLEEEVEVVSFAYDTSSPMVLGTVLAGSMMNRVSLLITTPFNGIGAQLSFGTSGQTDLFMGTSDNEPDLAGQYERTNLVPILTDDLLFLTIVPSNSTQGQGKLLYKLRRP